MFFEKHLVIWKNGGGKVAYLIPGLLRRRASSQ